MDIPRLQETDYLKAWASFFVSAMVGGALAGGVAGFILGAVLGMMKLPIETIRVLGSVAGFLAGLPVSYFLFRFWVRVFLIEKLTQQRPPATEPPNMV